MLRLIKNIFRIIVLFLIVGGALIFYARYIEPQWLRVKDIEISSPMVSTAADGFKIAVFGDTHFSDYYTPEEFDRVLKSLKKMQPDLVIFSGDLIDHFDTYTGDIDTISGKLAEIDAPYGKFAIFGNHDYGGGAENKYQSIMEAGGFKVLKNEYHGIDDLGIGVIGIDDVLIGYGEPEVASWGRPDYFNLVLAHEPDLIDQTLDYNVDLMISGHTHGRQINLNIFDDYILPPYGHKYINGLYQFHNERQSQLVVNPGIGMTKLPFRFLSPPELTCITLKNGLVFSDNSK
jgi:predicted MPP superfamily phosphohydrolase